MREDLTTVTIPPRDPNREYFRGQELPRVTLYPEQPCEGTTRSPGCSKEEIDSKRILESGIRSFSFDDGSGKGESLRDDLRDAFLKKIGPTAAEQFKKEEQAVHGWEDGEYKFWKSIPPGTPMGILRPFRPDTRLFDQVQSEIDAKEKDIADAAMKQLRPADIKQLSKDVEDFNFRLEIQKRMEGDLSKPELEGLAKEFPGYAQKPSERLAEYYKLIALETRKFVQE